MNKKNHITFYRYKLHLLITAIVCFVVSVLIQKNQEKKLTPPAVQLSIQSSITNYEKRINELVNNPEFLEQISSTNEVSKKFLAQNFELAIAKNSKQNLVAWNRVNEYLYFKNFNSYEISNDSLNLEYHIYRYKIYKKDTFYIKASLDLVTNNQINTSLFNDIKSLQKFYTLTTTSKTAYSVKNLEGQTVFYLLKKVNGFFDEYNTLAIILRFVAMIIFAFFVNNLSRIIAKTKGSYLGFISLFGAILIFRTISYFTAFPFAKNKIQFFDPSIYASNFLHPSLGDLFINLLLLFWLFSFLDALKNSRSNLSNLSKNYPITILLCIVFTSFTFLYISILRSLIIDSKIPFDVNNVFNLNEYTLVAFACICLSSINYIKITKRLYGFIIISSPNLWFTLMACVLLSVAGIFINNYHTSYHLLFCILLSLWPIIYIPIKHLFQKNTNRFIETSKTLSIFHIILFTLISSITTIYFTNKLDYDVDKTIAEKILIERNNKDILPINYNSIEVPDYAIYENNVLKEQNGNFIFLKNFNQTLDLYKTKIFVYEGDANTKVVIPFKVNYFQKFVTLFAYLFFTLLFVFFILFFIVNGTQLKKRITWYYFNYFASIRTQISATILAFTIVCFVSFGVVAIYFYIDKFNYNNELNINKTLTLNQKINLNSNQFDSIAIQNISNFYNDVNDNILVFDNNGKLIFSKIDSKKRNTRKGMYIDYNAYQSLIKNHNLFFKKTIRQENEDITYYFKPIYNNNAELLGVVCYADIEYVKKLREDLSGFIASLINITAFIFLLSAVFTLVITNRITSSFTLIRNKMKQISWKSSNEIIEWKKNDEIGALVSEYNVLVKKMEATAQAFAQTQKEVAWKEMAKQVAHEIKNPLTPMKLSIQYLQNKIDDDAPNIKQLSKTVANTLIEQINQLNNIASDFSQFANIGLDKPEITNINEVILGLIDLHMTGTEISFEHQLVDKNYNVFISKNQLIRLFTNLFKNAIEATPEHTKTKIIINQYKDENNKIITSVEDNGTGIPSEIQPNIFSLNFTTKNSGTGLGLMICKGVVENANGKIWFTSSKKGTKFFVELPLSEIL